jgi:hypothetical protein
MEVDRLYTTITDPQQITLTADSKQIESLFKLTQALAQVQVITDEDIDAEIFAYRQVVCWTRDVEGIEG